MRWWDGDMCVCSQGGAIETFVKSIAPDALFVVADGMVESGYKFLLNEPDYPTAPIVCLVCSRVPKPNLLLTPMDDATFLNGLNLKGPVWEERRPVAFWRGGASGFEVPTIRQQVVGALIDHPNSDVKITPWGGWEYGKNIPPHFFASRCSIQDHLQYKYILIVDGNCASSGYQWVFGSGSVPILVSHPKNDYWFKRYLKPMVNYVPIEYDLSDVKEKIDWLVTHDNEAREIANNALEFSRIVFSPEFQRKHIVEEIARIRNLHPNRD